jgi:ppGpp synthetase/RelA/SpoT-type nucleotidyltranferase
MIIPAKIDQLFTNLEPYINLLKQQVDDRVFQYCMTQGLLYTSRCKTLDSLSEKIESGRYGRWSELDDLFGCVIVVPTLAQEAAVLEFLEGSFETIAVKRRNSTRKSPDVFRFDSTRYYGRLRRVEGIAHPDELYAIVFEAQVRTAFEHAWSAATHGLTYKSEMVDWKRLRLTAQLKAAVEQLDLLLLAFEESVGHVPESIWPEIQHRRAIISAFQDEVQRNALSPDHVPKDWSRFSENLYALLAAAHKCPRQQDMEGFVRGALELISAEVRKLGADRVPKSLSLFQVALGILSDRDYLGSPFKKTFALPVTDELRQFYPSVRGYQNVFVFEG